MTRRLFLAALSCLPVSWQIKLGAAHRVPAWRDPQRAWLHTIFDGQGSILAYLCMRYNAASRGGLVVLPEELILPEEIILGKAAFAQYEREWDEIFDETPPESRFVKANPPQGASMYAFKGVWVFSLAHSVGWDDWHVGLLASRHGSAFPKDSAR